MLPTAFPPSIPKGFALGSDVDFAKECAKVVHFYRFLTEQIDRMFKLMHQAALCYRYVYSISIEHKNMCILSSLIIMLVRILVTYCTFKEIKLIYVWLMCPPSHPKLIYGVQY